MNNYNPYLNYANQNLAAQESQQKKTTEYKSQNSTAHFAMGIAAGAAVAYLLSNKKKFKKVLLQREKKRGQPYVVK